MKSSNTSDICANRGSDSSGGNDEQKTCTSYAQNVVDVIDISDYIKISSDDVDDIAESIDNMTISDINLFQDPPPKEECPICMLPMPCTNGVCGIMKVYMPCCGKYLCEGCSIAEDDEMREGNLKQWCALCRVPTPSPYTDEIFVKRLMKRANANDPSGFFVLGGIYRRGGELSQDATKSFEMMNKAAELGLPMAHYNVYVAYLTGYGVERDLDKAVRHLMLAAIGGDEVARHKLGIQEAQLGNMNRAMKHFMIAARSGYDDALKEVGEGYKAGHVTKDEYANTLRAHQNSRNEMKSEQRSRAAANRL